MVVLAAAHNPPPGGGGEAKDPPPPPSSSAGPSAFFSAPGGGPKTFFPSLNMNKLFGAEEQDEDDDIEEEDEEAAAFVSDAEHASQLRVRYSKMISLSAGILTKLTAFYYFHLASMDAPGSHLKALHLVSAKVSAVLAVFVMMLFRNHRIRCVRSPPPAPPPSPPPLLHVPAVHVRRGDVNSHVCCRCCCRICCAPAALAASSKLVDAQWRTTTTPPPDDEFSRLCLLPAPSSAHSHHAAAAQTSRRCLLLGFLLAHFRSRRCARRTASFFGGNALGTPLCGVARGGYHLSAAEAVPPGCSSPCSSLCSDTLLPRFYRCVSAAALYPDALCHGTKAAKSSVECSRTYAYAVEPLVKMVLPVVMQARSGAASRAAHCLPQRRHFDCCGARLGIVGLARGVGRNLLLSAFAAATPPPHRAPLSDSNRNHHGASVLHRHRLGRYPNVRVRP